jgi:hypothetical protein
MLTGFSIPRQGDPRNDTASLYLLFKHDATAMDVLRGYLHAFFARNHARGLGWGTPKGKLWGRREGAYITVVPPWYGYG